MSEMEIIKAYWEIPYKRREELRKQLKEQSKKNATAVIKMYCNEMCILIGEHIDANSRQQKHIDARMVLSYVLTKKGFTNAQIGEVLLKDHSTINHLSSSLRFDVDHNFKTSAFLLLEEFQKRIEQL